MSNSKINPNVVSLRAFALSMYRRLIDYVIKIYSLDDDYDKKGEKVENFYIKQILSQAYSMHSETKFKFIFKIISTDKKEKTNLEIIFNRFEQQKFKENCQKEANFQGEKNKARPLFIQFFEQVDIDSIPLLKKPKCKPFSAKLIGENSIDIGGPGRELFSYLVEELNDTY